MISVVIPAFNEQSNIVGILSDLEGQIIKHPYEVIVVNNNSTDKTAEIAKNFNCRVIKESKQGITWARWKGLEAAKGTIIAQIDADCRVNPHWLETLTAPFFQDTEVIFTHGDMEVKYFYFKSALYYRSIHVLKTILKHTTLMSSGYNMAYQKEVGKEIMSDNHYLQLKYYEDTYFSFQIGSKMGKKVFVPLALVNTSDRRIKQESLFGRSLRWTAAMGHYLRCRKFPSWAYSLEYTAYR